MKRLLYLFVLLPGFAYTSLGVVPPPIDSNKAKLTLFNYAKSERCEIRNNGCKSSPSVFEIFGVTTGDSSNYQFTYQTDSGRILSHRNSLYWDLRRAEPGAHVIRVKGYSALDLALKFQKNFVVKISGPKKSKKRKPSAGKRVFGVYAGNKERNEIINETFPLEADEVKPPRIQGIEFVSVKGTVPLCKSKVGTDCNLIQAELIVRPIFDQEKHARVIVGISASVGYVRKRGRSFIWDTSGVAPGTYKISLISLDATERFERGSKTFSVKITDKIYGPESRVVKNDRGEVFKTLESPLLDTKKHKNARPWIRRFEPASREIADCDKECVVKIFLETIDPDDDPFTEKFEMNAGKIVRKDGRIFWDLSGARPGEYELRVCADDGSGCDNDENWKRLSVTVN